MRSLFPAERQNAREAMPRLPRDGLRHKIVHAGCETGKFILFGRVGGQGNDVIYRERMDGA
jgi:hypothetical protein